MMILCEMDICRYNTIYKTASGGLTQNELVIICPLSDWIKVPLFSSAVFGTGFLPENYFFVGKCSCHRDRESATKLGGKCPVTPN